MPFSPGSSTGLPCGLASPYSGVSLVIRHPASAALRLNADDNEWMADTTVSCTPRCWCLQEARFRLAMMSSYRSYSMPPDKLLVVCGNVLLKSVLEAPRADAKRVFNDINDGKTFSLVNVRMDDETEVRFELLLDHSEFRAGRLNFKAFRDSLASLLQALAENVRRETEVPVFTDKGSGAMLFGIPGFTQNEDQQNVMMMSVNLRKPGCVQVKLMYLDPEQFNQRRAPDSDTAASG